MTVILYKDLDPTQVDFSKPFKQDHAYRLTVCPKVYIQTPTIVCHSRLMSQGELLPKASFVIPTAFADWLKQFEKRAIEHTMANKEALFHDDTISDNFIQASYQSCLTSGSIMTVKLSKELTVYDTQKDPISPEEVKESDKVVLILTPSHVDFGKRNFCLRWVAIAVKKVPTMKVDFVDDPNLEASQKKTLDK